MAEEEYEFKEELFNESPVETKSKKSNNKKNTNSPIGIRPRPCRPGNVAIPACKTEPIDKKKQWAPGAWQDGTRTSAFIPYKPPTLLTNLQRGNTQTEISLPDGESDVTFYTLAGKGELTQDNIKTATVDAPDENGLTALMWAAGYGQLNTVKLLLEAGADKEYEGPNGESPLHFASSYGHHDVVKLLLSQGADPDASDMDGNTPLIYAAQGDHPHVCHELLTHEADLTARNASGLSAYKAAIQKNALQAKAVFNNYLLQKFVSLPPDAPQQ